MNWREFLAVQDYGHGQTECKRNAGTGSADQKNKRIEIQIIHTKTGVLIEEHLSLFISDVRCFPPL